DLQCGGDLTQSHGGIYSPNYPNDYPDNADCTWRIQSPEHQMILLAFIFV
ncbi:deleted in malignant brain tumors 1 protein-like, partial [Clarias magur]